MSNKQFTLPLLLLSNAISIDFEPPVNLSIYAKNTLLLISSLLPWQVVKLIVLLSNTNRSPFLAEGHAVSAIIPKDYTIYL